MILDWKDAIRGVVHIWVDDKEKLSGRYYYTRWAESSHPTKSPSWWKIEDDRAYYNHDDDDDYGDWTIPSSLSDDEYSEQELISAVLGFIVETELLKPI